MSLILGGPYLETALPTQKGLGTPFCRRQTGRMCPTTGWTFDQEFNSLSLANMEGLANVYSNAGIEYELTYQNGIATMRTRDTTGNVTIDIWEIAANRQAISLLQNPYYLANVSTNDLTVIGRAIKDTSELSAAVTALNADGSGFTEPTVTGSTATARLWNKLRNLDLGIFFADQYLLRHKTNASNRGYYNVADTNVNCIYTQAQLYSEITNGTYWFFPCPAEIIGALNVIFSGLPSPPSNFMQGALKGAAQRTTSARNRVNIETEYDLSNIDEDNYYLAT